MDNTAPVPLAYLKRVFLEERKSLAKDGVAKLGFPMSCNPAGIIMLEGLEQLKRELSDASSVEDLDLLMRKWGRISFKEWCESL
jgi:hypothetical protein